MSDLDAIRRDRVALEGLLTSAGAAFKGKKCKCVFHEDNHASAGIYIKDDIWKFKCLGCGAGGDYFDIKARLDGKPLADVLREHDTQPGIKRAQTPPEVLPVYSLAQLCQKYGKRNEKVFVYTHPDTKAEEMVVIRIDKADGKIFLQCRPEAGGFVMKSPPKPLPLYNRSRVRAANRVVVVEGEGKVHALCSIKLIATCSPGGAYQAEHADWSPLAGKDVIIWPDNDKPGVEHYAKDARSMLANLTPPANVSCLDPALTGLGPKGDAVDFMESLADLPIDTKRQAVDELLASARNAGPGEELRSLWTDIIEGRHRAIPWEWCHLSSLTQALLPGTVTLLCGAGGASKSFMAIQAARKWHDDGVKVSLYELEGTRAEHLQRAVAQMERDSRVLDSRWGEDNPDVLRGISEKYARYAQEFGKCITAAPDQAPTLPELAQWVAAQADAGAEIIIVDPVSAATPSDKAWIADGEFVLKVKAAIRRTGTRLVLVIHPKKGHKGSGLDELAGGAAYGRLCNTVLWLDRHEPPKMLDVRTAVGIQNFGINRTITILKARHGRGTGHRIAMTFDSQSLTYLEHGVVEPKTKIPKQEPEEEERERRDFA